MRKPARRGEAEAWAPTGRRGTAGWVGLVAVLAFGGGIAPAAAFERTEPRAACADHEPLRRPFFGDLHVHTRYSHDAQTQGTRNGPRDAYRFAQGEPLGIQPYDESGEPLRTVRLARALDFAAVTDHAELFGEMTICETPGLAGHDSLLCRLHRSWPRASFFVWNTLTTYPERPVRRGLCGADGSACAAAARTPWRDIQEAAEAFYDRSDACAFTTFVGYEWTGGPGSNNIHRNVLFRNAAVPALPVTYLEEPQPEGLWQALTRDCVRAGPAAPACDVLVIPHNSNLSGGLLFSLPEGAGPEYARTRAAMEPLVEVMQHKGDSECRTQATGAGAPDELCRFEKLAYQNFAAKFVPWLGDEIPAANYVRDALGRGLLEQARQGVNPFAFGLVASTDTHLAASGLVDESASYPGHGGAGTPAANELPPGLVDDVEFNPGGLAVLWAEENSRDALFAAMRRREVYGTSGPRLVVRVYGGWDYPPALCEQSGGAFASAGDAGGVPMGGLLPAPPRAGAAPRFAIHALRDPGSPDAPGTPLQRIQIVKLWVSGDTVHERVLDVAGDAENGAGVDPSTCTPQGVGADALCTVWEDPDFDPATPALWYARVLENPTCRWHAQACLAAGVACDAPGGPPEGFAGCCDPAIPRTIQERAWTSPIWYTPPPLSAAVAMPSPGPAR
ncbi:DUF3604 domain-containing protein [Myxococcota bacterium]|nr:DUF3604 domain-containing protein [Myxococcota bacterium]